MDRTTKQYDILEVVEEADDALDAGEIADRVDRKKNTVSAALSSLIDDGYLEREGDGGPNDPYRYSLSGKGGAVVRGNSEEPDGPAGLEVLFDSAEDAEEAKQTVEEDAQGDEADADPEEVRRLREENDALSDRVDALERRLSATADGAGEEATISLPIADSDADLDHTTILDSLPTKRRKRAYMRMLFGLPDDEPADHATDSEQRAEENESVEVVQKDE